MPGTLAPITGTVSVALDGTDAQTVGSFTIPVDVTLDNATGIATVKAATFDEIKTAMATALSDAAYRLLSTLPTATMSVETIPTCPTCHQQLGITDPLTTIQHGENGSHIASQRHS